MSRIPICETCAKRCDHGYVTVCVECNTELQKINAFYHAIWQVSQQARKLNKLEFAASLMKLVARRKGLIK